MPGLILFMLIFWEIDECGESIRSVEMREPKTLDHENYIGLCFFV